jgi:hypothetical protein
MVQETSGGVSHELTELLGLDTGSGAPLVLHSHADGV